MKPELSRLNFRDLGGLPAADGKALRPGQIYRSEGPASFNPQHRQELAALGLQLVCDLRANGERQRTPNDWAANTQIMNIQITADLRAATSSGWGLLREDPSATSAHRAMVVNYRAMPAALRPYLHGLVAALLGGGLPVLIHCTAGKDRTGVLIALLLALLGVPREEVLQDYLRSDIFAKNLRLGGSSASFFEKSFGFTPNPEAIDTILGVDAAFLDAAFDAITETNGTLAAYFASAGVGTAVQAKLRARLLCDAAR